MNREDSPHSPRLWPVLALLGGALLLAMPGWRDLIRLPALGETVNFGVTYGLAGGDFVGTPIHRPLIALTVAFGLGAMILGYLVLVAGAKRGGWAFRPIVALVLILAGLAFVSPPSLSTDVFTYTVQGVMIVEGLDSVPPGMGAAAVPPSDNSHSLIQVAGSMDPWILMPATPYGPLWMWTMGGVHWVGGQSLLTHVLLFKALGLAGHLALIAMLWALWPSEDRVGRLLTIALVGLNPTAALETTAMAHSEGVMMALWMGATLAARRERPFLAGALLGLATGIKWIPLASAPILGLWIVRRERGWALLGWFALAFILASVGPLLPIRPWDPDTWEGLLHQSRLFGGGSLSHVVGLVLLWHFDNPAGPVVAAWHLRLVTLAIIGFVVALRTWRGVGERLEADQALLALLMAIGAASFFHAWYALWALPFAVLARREAPRLFRASLALSLAAPLALIVPIAAGTHGGWVQFAMFAVWATPTLAATLWPVRR